MQGKKSYIVLIIILLTYLIVTLILFKFGFFDKKDSYIVFNDTTALRINKDKYEFIEQKDIPTDKKYDIYDYNKYVGNYNLNFKDNTYRIYDDNYNLIKLEKNFLAVYTKKEKIKINTNNVEELNQKDMEILNKVLKSNDIGTYTTLSTKEKIKLRIKNKEMYLYNVSNDDYLNNDETVFSIVFIGNETEQYTINVSKTEKNNMYSVPGYFINVVADLNDDENDEIILDTQVYSQNGKPTRTIYTYKGNKYQELLKTNLGSLSNSGWNPKN